MKTDIYIKNKALHVSRLAVSKIISSNKMWGILQLSMTAWAERTYQTDHEIVWEFPNHFTNENIANAVFKITNISL